MSEKSKSTTNLRPNFSSKFRTILCNSALKYIALKLIMQHQSQPFYIPFIPVVSSMETETDQINIKDGWCC